MAAGVGVALVPGLARRSSSAPRTVGVPLATPVVRRVMAAAHPPEFRAPAAGAMLAILGEVAAAGYSGRSGVSDQSAAAR